MLCFQGTNLEHANLADADLTFASFKQCNLYGINMKGAKGIDTVTIDWINVGTEEAPEKLSGNEAKEWLLAAVNN